jgi:uncharacterized protein YgiM (DUF1202 family)
MENRLNVNRARGTLASALAAVMVLAAMLSGQAALASDAVNLPIGSYVRTGTVNNPKASDYLNLRALPSVGAVSLAQYRTGERVEVWGTLGDWSLVRVIRDDRTGYMMSAYLNMDAAAAQPVEQGIEDALIATSNGGRLNLRETPSQASRSLGLYYNGVTVRVLAYLSEEWAQVSIGEGQGAQYGYMQRQYLYTNNEATNRGKTSAVSGIPPSFIRPLDDWPLYSRPSDSAAVIARYYAIQPTEVLAVSAGTNGRWWHVRFPGDGANPPTTGFIPADDDSLLNHLVLAVNAPGPSYTLNLRNYPGYDSEVIGKVYNGALVTVLDSRDSTWKYVCVGIPGRGTVYGYMMNDMLVWAKNEVKDRRPTASLRSGLSVPMLAEPSAQADSLALYKADGREFTTLGVYGGFTQVYDWQTGLSGFFESGYLR